jgi:hypothetical protein
MQASLSVLSRAEAAAQRVDESAQRNAQRENSQRRFENV